MDPGSNCGQRADEGPTRTHRRTGGLPAIIGGDARDCRDCGIVRRFRHRRPARRMDVSGPTHGITEGASRCASACGKQFGDVVQVERPVRVCQSCKIRRATKQLPGGRTLTSQFSNAGVPVRLAQLRSIGMPHQHMVDDLWRCRATEQSCEVDLPSGALEQVLAPDHDIDTVRHVIHHHRELVRPVAVAVAEQQVSALLRRLLHQMPKQEIIEWDHGWLHSKPTRRCFGEGYRAVSTCTGIWCLPILIVPGAFGDLASRALAGEHQALLLELSQRIFVTIGIVGLPIRRRAATQGRRAVVISFEAEPFEVVENGLLELRLAARSVVIFDADGYGSAERSRDAPDMDCIDHMSKVQVTGGRGCESGTPWLRSVKPPGQPVRAKDQRLRGRGREASVGEPHRTIELALPTSESPPRHLPLYSAPGRQLHTVPSRQSHMVAGSEA